MFNVLAGITDFSNKLTTYKTHSPILNYAGIARLCGLHNIQLRRWLEVSRVRGFLLRVKPQLSLYCFSNPHQLYSCRKFGKRCVGLPGIRMVRKLRRRPPPIPPLSSACSNHISTLLWPQIFYPCFQNVLLASSPSSCDPMGLLGPTPAL